MSLVNQMLQDLEKRKADPDAVGEMPEGVRVTPVAPVAAARHRRLPFLLVLLVLVLAVGIYDWWSSAPASEGVTEPLASAPAATASAAEAPAPALPVSPVVPATAVSQSSDVPQSVSATNPSVPEKKQAAEPRPKLQRPTRENPPNVAVDRSKNAISTPPEETSGQLAERLFMSARQSYAQGRQSIAGEQLTQALALHPGHRRARNLRVQQLLESGHSPLAAELLAEGLRLLPDETPWLKALARIRLEAGQFVEAGNLLARVPEPTRDADFHALAGATAYRQQDHAQAAEHYRVALAQRPGVGRDWVALALVLEAQGHRAEAREAFRRALLTGNLDPRLQALAESRVQP